MGIVISLDELPDVGSDPRRVLHLDAVHNFRDLGGYPTEDGRTTKWGVLYRADGLYRLAGHDLEKVRDLGLKKVIDLRTDEELDVRGRFPLEYHPVTFHHLSVMDTTWVELPEVEITDRTPAGDRLQRIGPDAKVSTVWTWPNRPGVAGCAALDGTILVNLVNTKQTVAVRLAQGTGAVTGDPEVVRQDTHGHAWALQVSPDGNIWGATVNRTAGDPEKLDDVVFPLFPQGGGFPRSNADNT